MRPRAARAGEAGFTLVEAMIAMFFLSFIVGEMGMVYVYATRNTNLAQRITRANALADEAIEKSRNTDYNKLQLANASLGEACAITGTVATCTATIDNIYTRVRRIQPLPAGTALVASNSSSVDATVTFTDARGLQQTFRVASVVSRY